MVSLMSLWIPIVLSAVIVFFASFLMWMVLPHHRGDFRRLPDEDGFRTAIRKLSIAPGNYSFPHVSTPKEMGTPEFQKKMEEGPCGFLTLRPTGAPAMGKSMAISFTFNLVMSFVVAYLTSRTVPSGHEYLGVFRVAGTAAFLGYGGALFWGPIWFGKSWGATFREAFDALVYALLTAGAFGWLWPR